VSDVVIFGFHAIKKENPRYAQAVKALIGIHPRK
jgi:hypothetical protein